jgi:purine nucleosidase
MADESVRPPASGQGRLPVLFIHDAAIDDFIATMLLVAMPHVDLKGVVITAGDCIPQYGIEAANLLQQFMGRPDIPLALSEARGWNAFPWPYRGDCVNFCKLPILRPWRSTVPIPPPSGNQLVASLLEQAVKTGDKLTVLLTTGFTPLTNVLRARPELRAGIDRVAWMGGAINVPGNLDPCVTNPVVANKHAEWNVFWDPFAAQDGLELFSGIHDFPLDITNTVPISKELMAKLAVQGQKHSFSQLAFEAYVIVINAPLYYMWNVCTTVFLARPDLYAQPQQMPLEVVQWGFEQGWMRQSAAAKNSQNVYLSFSDLNGFYDYVAAQLARSA